MTRFDDRGRPDDDGPRRVVPQVRFEVFEARVDGDGAWRLDESSGRRPTWVDRLKQALLVAVSLAVMVAVWIFALALALVLAPLVALGAWWMWRRLQATMRARAAGGHPGGRPDAP